MSGQVVAVPAAIQNERPHEDPAAEFAAAAAHVAPDVDVRILHPGERTDF